MEYNQSLYMLFLDYEKACSRVNQEKVWETAQSYYMPKNLMNAINPCIEE